MIDEDKRELDERWSAIQNEPDEAKRMRLVRDYLAELEQKQARAAVELVERVRASLGDKAADETLQTIRNAVRGRSPNI